MYSKFLSVTVIILSHLLGRRIPIPNLNISGIIYLQTDVPDSYASALSSIPIQDRREVASMLLCKLSIEVAVHSKLYANM